MKKLGGGEVLKKVEEEEATLNTQISVHRCIRKMEWGKNNNNTNNFDGEINKNK